jgi:hypothetical protein
VAIPGGQRLGPYEILAAIGAGGMGELYRARDTRLDRIVAPAPAAKWATGALPWTHLCRDCKEREQSAAKTDDSLRRRISAPPLK